jgi:hypothetical protein
VTRGFKFTMPAEDILCTPAIYRAIFDKCGLQVVAEQSPLGRREDDVAWLSETRIAPWTIYVLAKRADDPYKASS